MIESSGTIGLRVVLCCLAGIVVGGVAHWVGRFFYLIILFPIVMGMAGSWALGFAINRGKIRSILVAVILGFVCTISLYGSMHVFDYLQFKSEVKAAIAVDQPELANNPEQVEAVIDEWLESEVGDTGFVGYMKYSAKQGVSIGRVGGESGNIGKVGT